jgi:fibronectin type 3 domain-containing protein
MNSWLKALAAAAICGVMAGCGGSDDSPAPVAPTTPPPTQATVPAIPTNLSVEPGDQVNTVQWDAVADATSYNLYWADALPLTKQSATLIAGAVSPYKHTGLTNGKLLYYAITARNNVGESDLSAAIGAMPVAAIPVPAAPAQLNATAGDASVVLSWSKVTGADTYSIYWSKATPVVVGAAGVTKIDKLTATGYTQVGLTNGDRYYYVVAAVNASGEGPVSAEASATPQLPAPGAPLSLAATAGDTQVQLSWSPSLNATTYNVYWSNVAGVKPGSAGVTQIPGVTATNYMHTGLKNGDTYYYVVTAVTAMIEGAASAETSARPLPPAPPAPLGLTAIAAKDVLEIAVQWFDVPDYPSSTAPVQVGYNLYRGLQPGVASYYKDAAKAIKVANVTAPYIDTALTTATTYYYVVTSFAPGFSEVESAPSGEVTATSGRAGGGGGEEGFGNNLSVPLVFADSYGLTGLKISGSWPGVGPFATLPAFDFNTGLRPLSTESLTAFPSFDASTAVAIAGITYYPQGTASTWQAEWRNNAAGSTLEVVLDWGDALLARTYTANSVIRIETTLVQDASIAGVTDTMTAYKMALLSGSGITELRGTDKSTFASASRNVFAINARLKIEKISTDGSPDTVIYNKAIYEAFGTTTEGEGGGRTNDSAYAAELNQSGLIVYGKNFFMTQVTGVPSKTGQYRITFSLDPEAAVGAVKVPNHIRIVNKSDAGATLAPDGLSSSVVITVN